MNLQELGQAYLEGTIPRIEFLDRCLRYADPDHVADFFRYIPPECLDSLRDYLREYARADLISYQPAPPIPKSTIVALRSWLGEV